KRYHLHHSKDNISSSISGDNIEELKRYAKDNNITTWEIFRTGYYSTTQEEYLVVWYDKGGRNYWSNRAEKDESLFKKNPDPEQYQKYLLNKKINKSNL
ncbi:hypothetical protein M0Q97_05705, partial [Candidatus Dojkabacteria bacterium]|nr:hypothetical protein [Candidatus Dojkabacteria bacterium]